MSWWRHHMETFSGLLALCAGNSPVIGEFPSQRPVTRSFDGFVDLRLNERLSKQSWGWWFEAPSCSLWRHCNVYQHNQVNSLCITPASTESYSNPIFHTFSCFILWQRMEWHCVIVVPVPKRYTVRHWAVTGMELLARCVCLMHLAWLPIRSFTQYWWIPNPWLRKSSSVFHPYQPRFLGIL